MMSLKQFQPKHCNLLNTVVNIQYTELISISFTFHSVSTILLSLTGHNDTLNIFRFSPKCMFQRPSFDRLDRTPDIKYGTCIKHISSIRVFSTYRSISVSINSSIINMPISKTQLPQA